MNYIITLTKSINDAFGRINNYQATIDDGKGNQIPNPITPDQFTQSYIDEFVNSVVHQDSINQAEASAEAAAAASSAKVQSTLQ